jgi:Fur family transcriptional regulator, ferric uptake regulator
MPAVQTLQWLTEVCRARDIKLTGQRRAILQVIAIAHGHPSANQVHELVCRDHPRISLATVYRTLKTLRDAGIVEEHTFGEDRCHYEVADGPHHDHLIDAVTGQIVEFVDPEIEKLQHAIAKRLGYRLTAHKLELFGVRTNDQ